MMTFIIWKETDTLISHQVPTALVPRGPNSALGSQAPHPTPSHSDESVCGGGGAVVGNACPGHRSHGGSALIRRFVQARSGSQSCTGPPAVSDASPLPRPHLVDQGGAVLSLRNTPPPGSQQESPAELAPHSSCLGNAQGVGVPPLPQPEGLQSKVPLLPFPARFIWRGFIRAEEPVNIIYKSTIPNSDSQIPKAQKTQSLAILIW